MIGPENLHDKTLSEWVLAYNALSERYEVLRWLINAQRADRLNDAEIDRAIDAELARRREAAQ